MSAKRGQKGRKIGRNKDWCKSYRNTGKRERNKALRLLRHFKRYGYANSSAVHCYNNLASTAKPKGVLTVPLEKPKGKRLAPREKMPPVRPMGSFFMAAAEG